MRIKIEIKKGDITTFEGDAIVNAANNQLWMGGGVAGAIKRVGGQKIEEEAVSKGPIPIGGAISTSAGKLKVKFVIHAAVMGRDLKTSGDYIKNATINALKEAERLRVRTIAFPALGTGVGGFPYEECANIMKKSIEEAEKEISSLQEIVFYLFDEEALKVFEKVFRKNE
jgi:O-acetyl-ADP-ribose deacetylase (regulator of RNase III)